MATCRRRPLISMSFVVGTLLSLLVVPALATEGGGTSKLLGVETVLAGVMPPPGQLRMLVSASDYRATRTHDAAGNPRPGLSDFALKFSGLAVRVQYVWPDAKLLGADIETRLGYALYVDGDLSFDVATPRGRVHRAGSAQGGSDAIVAPITLGWHSDSYHQIVGFEFFVPTGSFDAAQLVNKGRGYSSAAPAYRFTWYPIKPLEVSGNLVYLVNRENSDSKIKSGRELSFDYGVGYTFAPGWQGGASGYLYRQVSDDQLNGAIAGDGNRGRVFATGPYIRYFSDQGFGVTLKWQVESGAQNKTQGNRLFLQVAKRLY